MRTAIHIVIILLVGLGIGFAIRGLRGPVETAGVDEGPLEVPAGEDFIDPDRPTRLEPPPKPQLEPGDDWLQSFEFTERDGSTVSSESLKGQPYVVSFFFTLCPSICVTQNQKLGELQEAFDGQDVKFLSISVDPENDTPEKLREYAARFGADPEQWLFLTADDPIYVQRVGAEVFQVSSNLQHTERFILVDAEGEIDGLYHWNEPRSFRRLKKDIAAMLEQQQDATVEAGEQGGDAA
ncbi:SCO family protein [Roseimaritima sediminicola]|uniref:SCO family protein n=1 Tax=Roseimaritima sediminicola TaxID=2662066 RepID=UPI0012984AB5|nr:SCO family protein [Roseimaritima sediminicola]